MPNPMTLLSIKSESTWIITGPVFVRMTGSEENKFYLKGRKKIGSGEVELGKVGDNIRTSRILSYEYATDILARLQDIVMPAVPNFEMGPDGGFTELTVGGYDGKAHYRWWSDPPEGWEPLDRLAKEVLKLSGIDERLDEIRRLGQ